MPCRETERCWVCGSQDTYLFRKARLGRDIDARMLRITDASYGSTAAMYRCHHCGFVFADAPDQDRLADLYRDMEDPEYVSTAETRRVQMQKLLDLAASHHPEARSLLDIGAATGLLVSEARARGYEAIGIEPSRHLVEAAARLYGIKLECGCLEDCFDRLGRYDLITLIDVIEHTSRPMEMLRLCQDRLAHGGRLIIVTPDISSLCSRLLGARWWHFRPAHVCFFDRRSMRTALELCGLAVVRHCPVSWYFPLAYLCVRLKQYARWGGLQAILDRAAHSRRLGSRRIRLTLFDSRAYVIRRKDEQGSST